MDQNCRQQIISEDYTDFIFSYETDFSTILSSPDICYTNISFGYTIAHVPIHSVPKNFIQLGGYDIFPHCYGLLDVRSLEASGVSRLNNIPGINYQGNGVLVGFIDTGIDYTHEAFKNADGTTRITSIWDQTIHDGLPPAGFSFGTEYTREQINMALQSEDPFAIVPTIDEYDHGTFMAGIAAGTRNISQNFSGVVPAAEIIVVKLKPAKTYIKDFWVIPNDVLCYQASDILLGIEYLRNVAKTKNIPIAICIGLGTSQGSHDGTDVLSRYLSATSIQNGVAVVIAAGNEGNRGHHYYGQIDNKSVTNTVELRVGPNEMGFTMELWGQAPNTYSIDILTPTGEYIPRIPARIGESREIRFIFENTVINVDYFILEKQAGDELILMRFRNPTEGIWRFNVNIYQGYISSFHIWLPIVNFITVGTYFSLPAPDTTLTSPANTLRPIVPTAYDYSNKSLFLNSSRGFTREGAISPDFSAPGVNLIGPTSQNNYRLGSGTSVAAAHTTGVAAMLLQWGIINKNFIRMNSLVISNILKRGAIKNPNITYPDTAWGYGILDIYNSFLSLRGDTQT